jgi:hypothetical protein
MLRQTSGNLSRDNARSSIRPLRPASNKEPESCSRPPNRESRRFGRYLRRAARRITCSVLTGPRLGLRDRSLPGMAGGHFRGTLHDLRVMCHHLLCRSSGKPPSGRRAAHRRATQGVPGRANREGPWLIRCSGIKSPTGFVASWPRAAGRSTTTSWKASGTGASAISTSPPLPAALGKAVRSGSSSGSRPDLDQRFRSCSAARTSWTGRGMRAGAGGPALLPRMRGRSSAPG